MGAGPRAIAFAIPRLSILAFVTAAGLKKISPVISNHLLSSRLGVRFGRDGVDGVAGFFLGDLWLFSCAWAPVIGGFRRLARVGMQVCSVDCTHDDSEVQPGLAKCKCRQIGQSHLEFQVAPSRTERSQTGVGSPFFRIEMFQSAPSIAY